MKVCLLDVDAQMDQEKEFSNRAFQDLPQILQ